MTEEDVMRELMRASIFNEIGKPYTSTASTSSAEPMTADKLLAMIQESEGRLETISLALFANDAINGRAAIKSFTTTDFEPYRVHKRRRGQTLAYHNRIQKKWSKRWGGAVYPRVHHVRINPYEIYPTPLDDDVMQWRWWPSYPLIQPDITVINSIA